MPDSAKDRGRPIRVEDVARAAGVSPITVSRALSAPHKVRLETRERVAEAVASTGYIVNSIASTLKSGRSSIVTVFVASMQNPHLATTVQGIIDAFSGSRFHLMFAQTGYNDELHPEIIEPVLPFRPAGMALIGVGCDRATRKALLNLDLPVVETGERSHPIDMQVQISSFEAGRLMGEHFGRQGFARVAFCGHTLGHGAERLRGFHAGLQIFRLRPELVLPIEGAQSFEDGVSSLRHILSKLSECDAIFYGTDLLAMGALMEARHGSADGLKLPAIAGYGDLDFAEHLVPALTTIRVPNYDIGRRAGEMLRRRLEGETVEEPIVHLPVQLLARESTANSVHQPRAMY
ncbi:MAG TPA: LacI family DNA-binding transcriptional regulator [Devosia sp.]|nr:LacI family DNA-binding transcriptional regulator [Devosia sp.]